jgi:hypothetical protein
MIATLSAAALGREVTWVPVRGVPFFLSYAHATSGSARPGAASKPDQLAERLFYDLTEHLDQLIAPPTGMDIGFMDRGMWGGTKWPDELADALSTGQVMVALLSPRYLASSWCGKEWYAFRERSARRLPGARTPRSQKCVIPVHWVPCSVPEAIGEDMIFSPDRTPDPDLPELYRQNGVYGLLTMGQEDKYQIITWQLSKLISNVYHGLHLEHRKYRQEDLVNIFDGGVPS